MRLIPQPSCPKSTGISASRPPICPKPSEALYSQDMHLGPFPQMRPLRLREVKCHSQGRSARMWVQQLEPQGPPGPGPALVPSGHSQCPYVHAPSPQMGRKLLASNKTPEMIPSPNCSPHITPPACVCCSPSKLITVQSKEAGGGPEQAGTEST